MGQISPIYPRKDIHMGEYHDSFGALLRELRNSRGLTQTQLSEEARVGLTTITRLEKNHAHKHRPSTLSQIFETLGQHLPFSNAEIARLGEFFPHPDEYYRKFGLRNQEFDENEWRILRAFHRLKQHGRAEEAVEIIEALDKATTPRERDTQSLKRDGPEDDPEGNRPGGLTSPMGRSAP